MEHNWFNKKNYSSKSISCTGKIILRTNKIVLSEWGILSGNATLQFPVLPPFSMGVIS